MANCLAGTCTIPPDPTEEQLLKANSRYGSRSSRVDYSPAPRIRPSAGKIYEMNKGSVGLLFGLDQYQISTGFKAHSAKDHKSLNIQKMREIQRKAKEKSREKEEDLAPKPLKVPPSCEKYANVKSKIFDNLHITPETPRQTNFLRARSRPGSAPAAASQGDLKPESPRPKNIIAQNIVIAERLKATQPFSLTVKHNEEKNKAEKENYVQSRKGKVPKYIAERKQQWEHEFLVKSENAKDPEMPPGHRRMPEEERKSTLINLENTRKDLISQLQRLPLSLKTQKQIKLKESLEAKISELEEAIVIFSRPKVFVKLDD